MSIGDHHRPVEQQSIRLASEGIQTELRQQHDGAGTTFSRSKDGLKSYPQSLEMTPIPGYDGQKQGVQQAGLLDFARRLRQRWLYPDMGDGGRHGWDWEKGGPAYFDKNGGKVVDF